ncbi:ASCH domain-containing protein [Actinomadura barringtoniae]|uniref:ASCH domain-containing protein n=1 Tax=Actinomadura barringtoniae TaxID=1427535 RepID=A0A939P611_9ACTN|nr:ASCH domain-containing protein [Actinomadura barringtoniae]MBO2446037.1 ASCH domain-containing protein [Actinomadura barringtoniae]
MSHEDLPRAEFAFPGPLRDRLVAAVLSGAKTTTSSLVVEYERDGEPLPMVGRRAVVIDSDGRPVAIIETAEVRTLRIGDVDLEHARSEGEGHRTVAEWRVGHEAFWNSAEMRDHLGDPAFGVTDDTLMVAERFQVTERL